MNTRVGLAWRAPAVPDQARLPRLESEMLHVGALAQSRYWWDRFGKGRPLPRMNDRHVLKLEATMRDRATHFALSTRQGHAEECEACEAMLASPEAGYAPPPVTPVLAEAWIRTTPLHHAVIAEITRRGLPPLRTSRTS